MLKFNKKPLTNTKAESSHNETKDDSKPPVKSSKPNTDGGLPFIKQGKAAIEALQQEDKKAEQAAKDAESTIHRFYLPTGKDTSVTFLTGDLLEGDGILDIQFAYEHQINRNGTWKNWYLCTQETEPCPVCEGGSKPYYAGYFLVIDHSEFKSKSGKLYKDTIKLFVAKRETIKKLIAMSKKRDGLRGCRYDVSRTSDTTASVGDVFDFTTKYSEEQLVKMFGEQVKNTNLIPYLQDMYMSAEDLKKLGFGVLSNPVGSEKAPKDYSDEL